MTLLPFEQFYRLYGVRLQSHMVNPVFFPLEKLIYPQNSLLHVLETDEPEEIGISVDDPLIARFKDHVLVENVTKHLGLKLEGAPRERQINAQQLINEYFRKERGLKNAELNRNMANNKQNLMVVNYGLLDQRYFFAAPTFRTPYLNWKNKINTFVTSIKEHIETNRSQFFFIDIPSLVPSISKLLAVKDGLVNEGHYQYFNTDNKRMLLELWYWFTDNPQSSLLLLSPDELKQVNIVWSSPTSWVVTNLSVIDNWIKRARDADDKSSKPSGPRKKATYSPEAMGRVYLRFLMSLQRSLSKMAESDELDDAVSLADEQLNQESEELERDLVNRGVIGGSKPKLSALQQAQLVVAGDVTKKTQTAIANMTDKEVDQAVAAQDNDEEDIDLNAIDLTFLDEMEIIDQQTEEAKKIAELGTYTPYVEPDFTVDNGVAIAADELAVKGIINVPQATRLKRISQKYKTIPNPFGGKGTVEDMLVITPEELAVPDVNPIMEQHAGIVDASMVNSSLNFMHKHYINNIMKKDLMSVMMMPQRMGFAVQDIVVKHNETLLDNYYAISIKVVAPTGSPSTLNIKVPVVKEDGTYVVGGVKSRMRTQAGDVPIRKTGPSEVALTSYYNKIFVERSDRSTFNYDQWIQRGIGSKAVGDNPEITDILYVGAFDYKAEVPRAYSGVSKAISAFRVKDYYFSFNYGRIDELFTKEGLIGSKGMIPVAKSKTHAIYMDNDGNLHEAARGRSTGEYKYLGPLEEFLGIEGTAPMDVATIAIFSKPIPLGIMLGHRAGLGRLLATLNVKYDRVVKGGKAEVNTGDVVLKFADETLICRKPDAKAKLIVNSLNWFKRELKNHSVYLFDKKDIYEVILANMGFAAVYAREMENMFKLWLDPITEGILKEMEEPTNFFQLLLRSADLLTSDKHPKEIDLGFMRHKGYERFAGMMYSEMAKAIRQYNAKPVSVNSKLTIHPDVVWFDILKDQTTIPIEESNPIHSLKEAEVIVMSGFGGRSGQSMTAKARMFHESHLQVIGENTVDNGDVGTIVFAVPDANYRSVRGLTKPPKTSEKDLRAQPAKLVSTSMLMAPFLDGDDAKRANFASVQNSQSVRIKGQKPYPVRTGYDSVIGHRTTELFCKTADDDGVVIDVTDNTFTVKYRDGKEAQYQHKRRFGKWSGYTMPHDIEINVVKGERFKKGTVLCYNKGYFKMNPLVPNTPLYMGGAVARVQCVEKTTTLEDACEAAPFICEEMATEQTVPHVITATFDQEVKKLVKLKQEIDHETILCTIANVQSVAGRDYDDSDLENLEELTSGSRRAGMTGVVDHIEVFYTGDLENMSESLRELAEKSDSYIYRLNKNLGRRATNGQVEVGHRVDKIVMGPDTVAIIVYVTGEVAMGVGDKAVAGHQMKTVVSEIMDPRNRLENGEAIGMKFSYESNNKRIVNSFKKLGVFTTASVVLSERMANMHFGL